MKNKTKFGFSILLALAMSMSVAYAQAPNAKEKPSEPRPATAHEILKKDWENFQAKAEASVANPAQKPALEKEYNQLVERIELLCEGIQMDAKSSIKGTGSPVPIPANKPKKEQAAMK